jgi:hypothetical protein
MQMPWQPHGALLPRSTSTQTCGWPTPPILLAPPNLLGGYFFLRCVARFVLHSAIAAVQLVLANGPFAADGLFAQGPPRFSSASSTSEPTLP